MEILTEKLLSNLNNFAELGRQRAFELGNPFYYKEENDHSYWRKGLPTGEIFLVLFEVEYDENVKLVKIIDTFQKRIN
jgi:hypothetical protein